MPQLKVSKKADSDLLEIRNYTQEKWGIEQRDKYLDKIDARFKQLAENPDYPTAIDIGHIRSDYYSLQINEHFIIYRKYSYGVRIVRVLGQVMDIKQHL